MEQPHTHTGSSPGSASSVPGAEAAPSYIRPDGTLGYDMDESFRDTIGTLDEKGKRKWIYAKLFTGRFLRRRRVLSWVYLGFLFAAPFVRIGGQPLLLFNFLERKFVLFGQPFWPQDFYLFALVALTAIVGLVIFTVAFGRIFCGWVCPQTIFMEFVFRRIEYWIDGDAPAQRRLTQQPWNSEKITKRVAKHSLFWLFSFLIGNTFLAYLIGSEALIEIVTESPAKHLAGFSGMLVFSTVFYFVFSRFREQVCIVACPYGRLQGVLLDNNSLVVAYDYSRGEPRGKYKKEETRTLGDCINCYQCVQVCPTGIDIRNGTQLECINCTACIDACDDIMDKIGKPRGLVRYATQNEIALKKPFRFTPRMKAYARVLTVLLGVVITLLLLRSDVQSILTRMPGTTYSRDDRGRFVNTFQYQLVNKTNDDKVIHYQLLHPAGGELRLNGMTQNRLVPAGDRVAGLLILSLPRAKMTGYHTDVKIGVYSGEELLVEEKIQFTGPIH
ncbi:MAG: cytochrome c oxidase accessory protein CcoG [Sphingobacteriia bacterium]